MLAVIFSTLVWGFGHSNYLIFPMWFRGVEVACLGLFLSYIYLNYGIIPALVAHYVFDVFWCSSGFLLGKANFVDFFGSLGVLLLPLLFGVMAFVFNRSDEENPMRWKLNKHQIYNLQVLKTFLKEEGNTKNKTAQELTQELVAHGWDIAIVEIALQDHQRPVQS